MVKSQAYVKNLFSHNLHKRMAQAKEVVSTAVFLYSRGISYITGAPSWLMEDGWPFKYVKVAIIWEFT